MDGKEKVEKVKSPAIDGQRERFVTTDEKAQYEVFTNGTLPRETISKWIRNDLTAVLSFVHGILNDEKIFGALTDAYYERYRQLHDQSKEVQNGVSNKP